MAKISDLIFSVVVDSNILFTKDVAKVAGMKFTENWAECCGLGKMTLMVPDVVKEERLYQMVSTARKAVQTAQKNLETISKVSGQSPPKLPSFGELKAGAESNFQKWILKNKATIVPIPYDKVDWKQVVNDALWRVRPFEEAGENEDSEKGFRDKLILESLREVLNTRPKEKVVFISNDTILRETAQKELGGKALTTYKELGGFVSYLKLTHEHFTKEFASEVVKKVPLAFYSPDNPECVYSKFKVNQLIVDKFGFALASFVPIQAQVQHPLAGIPGISAWAAPQSLAMPNNFSPISNEKFFVDETEYDKITVTGKYSWKTRVRCVRLFKNMNHPMTLGSEWLNEVIRIAKFDVYWEAVIDNDVNFSDLSIGEIKFVEQTSEMGFLSALKYGNFELATTETPSSTATTT